VSSSNRFIQVLFESGGAMLKIYKVKQIDGRCVIIQAETRGQAAMFWGKSQFMSMNACEAREKFSRGIDVQVEDELGKSNMLVILSIDVFDQDDETEDN
tara:strand:- start:189 stop:485 length:297 start_codon:yes stop_codon:yes gene_type:complete